MDDTADYASEAQDRMQRAGAAETGSDLERFYFGAGEAIEVELDTIGDRVHVVALALGRLEPRVGEG